MPSYLSPCVHLEYKAYRVPYVTANFARRWRSDQRAQLFSKLKAVDILIIDTNLVIGITNHTDYAFIEPELRNEHEPVVMHTGVFYSMLASYVRQFKIILSTVITGLRSQKSQARLQDAAPMFEESVGKHFLGGFGTYLTYFMNVPFNLVLAYGVHKANIILDVTTSEVRLEKQQHMFFKLRREEIPLCMSHVSIAGSTWVDS
ncbi:hypothetical protein ACTXT7_001098 [Hymenolepis weldensis]